MSPTTDPDRDLRWQWEEIADDDSEPYGPFDPTEPMREEDYL